MNPNSTFGAVPVQAYLCTDSYAGRSEQAVMVVGETPKKYRIRTVMRTRMPGRCRWHSLADLFPGTGAVARAWDSWRTDLLRAA